jgi:hypothetical protein
MNRQISSGVGGNSSTLLEKQAEALLNELCTIVNEKWPILNTNGHSALKSILNAYTGLFRNEDDDEQSEEEKENNDRGKKEEKMKSTLNFKSLTTLNECNENFERLADVIKSFEAYTSRLAVIRTNIFNLLNMKLDIFECVELDLTSFRDSLASLCHLYKQEFDLKSTLVSQSLFRSRFNRENQIAIMSTWIHQPHLNELAILKLVSFVKFYFLNKNK